jgi:hypothetical protein
MTVEVLRASGRAELTAMLNEFDAICGRRPKVARGAGAGR